MKKEFLTSKLAKFSSVIAATLLALGSAGAGIGIASAATETTSTTSATMTPGSLSLDAVPEIAFGNTNTISTSQASYASSSVGDLSVSNPGNMGGWSVTVAGTKFTNGSSTLNDASLSLKNSDTDPYTSTTGAAAGDDPTPATATITSTASLVESAGAATDTDPVGVGQFSETFGSGDATLSIPPETVLPGTYTSTLTWTLASTPSSTTGTSSTTPAA